MPEEFSSPQDLIHNTPRKPAAPLSPAHEPLVARIYATLDRYLTPRKLGRVWSGIDVMLDRREGLVLRPDIIFVVEGRESIVTDYVWGPPDMVLEVTSPLTHMGQLQERVALFSVYGVREYWLVQPEQREVALLELAHGGVRQRSLFDYHTAINTPLLADFNTPLSELLG